MDFAIGRAKATIGRAKVTIVMVRKKDFGVGSAKGSIVMGSAKGFLAGRAKVSSFLRLAPIRCLQLGWKPGFFRSLARQQYRFRRLTRTSGSANVTSAPPSHQQGLAPVRRL